MSTEPIIKKKSFWRKLLTFSIWSLVILILLLVIGFFCTNAYLKSNKTKILEDLSFLNKGTISFDEAHISVWDDFPSASIVLSNVRLQDSMYHVHQELLLEAGELRARLGTAGWRELDFEINGFVISDGAIHLYKYADGYDNLGSVLTIPDRDSVQLDPSWIKEFLKLDELEIKSDQLDFELANVRLNVINEVKSTAYVADLRSVKAALDQEDNAFDLDLDLDIHVDELTFNNRNGSYLVDTELSGSFTLVHDADQYTVDTFDLSINDEVFIIDAMIHKGHVQPSYINVINDRTDLANTLPLLPWTIRKEIAPYKIKKDFPSRTQIILEEGQRARVEVLFALQETDLEISGIRAEDATFQGRFINRKYDDRRSRTEDKGNIRLILDDVSVRQGEIGLKTDQIFIQSNPQDKASVRSIASIRGPAPTISEFYDSDKFLFRDGRFELKAEVEGPLHNLGQLILESDAVLNLMDIDVLYRPADVSIPIAALELIKASGDAAFSISTSTLSRAYDYQIDGGLSDLAGLLVDFADVSTVSDVHLFSERLGWADYIELFSKPEEGGLDNPKDEGASKRSMKATLKGIYDKIQPTVTIAIDTFEYWDKVDMYDLTTGVHFDGANTIILDSTRFRLDRGSVALEARVDISDPEETSFVIEAHADHISLADLLPQFNYFNVQLLADQTTHSEDFDIDIQIEGKIHDVLGVKAEDIKGTVTFVSKSYNGIAGKVDFQPILQGDSIVMHSVIDFSGSPVLFNDFFKNEQFFFEDQGRFISNFDYTGDLLSFDQLIAEADIEMDIKDAGVLYEEADIIFELSDVSTVIHGDTLEYILDMRSEALDRELTATGVIENVSELIYGNTGKQLKTSVDVYSPVINLEHATAIFETPTDTISSYFVDKEVDNKTKSLVSGLFNRFDPDIAISIDSLVVTGQIGFTDFTSGLRLADSTTLVLEQTDFKYSGGQVGAKGSVYIGANDIENFSANVSTQHIDIHQLLHSLDYLNEDRLRDAEYIGGTLTFDLDFDGALMDLEFVDLFTDAKLDFLLDSLELKGVQLISDFGVEMKREDQFDHIRFAQLSNVLTFKESRIDVPQMEVQSTAGHVFVEGHWDRVKGSNLWVTIPLTNLKKKTIKDVPVSRPYARDKWKVYMELYSLAGEPIDNKLRISKRKFYKQRGMLKQFKIDRRVWRDDRRAARNLDKTNPKLF